MYWVEIVSMKGRSFLRSALFILAYSITYNWAGRQTDGRTDGGCAHKALDYCPSWATALTGLLSQHVGVVVSLRHHT